jgi:hypothetical protein
LFVFKTDQGYIKGDLRSGVEFVAKEQARKFTLIEVIAYGESIAADMFDLYNCKTVEFERL